MRPDFNIPDKANRVLNVILLAFLLILIRVWYLGCIQHDEHLQQARKPQRKTVVDRVERATIRDRFNIPLALNKIQYNAAVRYADIRQIPSVKWIKNPEGKRIREPVRNNYIQRLSQFLAKELGMDPIAIEDIIHAKASLFPHTPFTIKEDISEAEYYKLRLLEKDWVGMEAQRVSKRIYPQGKTACDVVGYLGAISQKEYFEIAAEIKKLQAYIEKRDAGELVLLPPGYNDPIEVRARLKELQEKAYTINDLVGKTGIESVYDEVLRGFHGKKVYEIDPKGNSLRELPSSKKSVSGQRVLLSISSELQQYAEELLAHNEAIRDIRNRRGKTGLARPWIKGGAIVAMDPKTGEILALASYPRFNPNDFIPSDSPALKKQKQRDVLQWLENEAYVGEIWDGKRPLERERYSFVDHAFYNEIQPLTWEEYLNCVLPPDTPIRETMNRISTIEVAYHIQKQFENLLTLTEQDDAEALVQVLYEDGYIPVRRTVQEEKKELIKAKLFEHPEKVAAYREDLDYFLSSISYNDDKVLVLDLCRLLVKSDAFDQTLIEAVGQHTLSFFRELNQSVNNIQHVLYEEVQKIHHEIDFSGWRQLHFKEYLKQKRKEEKENKKYVQPYTEYLAKIEKSLFKEFWQVCRFLFLDTYIHGKVRISIQDYPQLTPYLNRIIEMRKKQNPIHAQAEKIKQALAPLDSITAIKYLKTMRDFNELNRPLYGKYRYLRNTEGKQLEKHLAGAFYPLAGFGYGRSQAYRQSAVQGSVFKIVIAYEALKEKYEYLKENHMSLSDLNPLTLVDQVNPGHAGSNKQILGYTTTGEPIRRFHKGGLMPRSHPNIGKIDVKGAIEQSSNMYFSYLSVEHITDISLLENCVRNFGYGSKTGIDLNGEIAGNIPNDLIDNRTGLYSFTIGQHSFVVTPLQTSVMMSAMANHGKVLKPQIVLLTAGKQSIETPFSSNFSLYPFKDQLSLVGIHFPLFTESLTTKQSSFVNRSPTVVKREIFFPPEIRTTLLEGMERVINGSKGSARPEYVRSLWGHSQLMTDYLDMRHQIVGKTGTAEILYKKPIDAESKAEMNNLIWFACIGFPENEPTWQGTWKDPEIVVIVYLRFTDSGGKEAAPLATQIIKKWREICAKHGKSSYIAPLSKEGKEAFENTEW